MICTSLSNKLQNPWILTDQSHAKIATKEVATLALIPKREISFIIFKLSAKS